MDEEKLLTNFCRVKIQYKVTLFSSEFAIEDTENSHYKWEEDSSGISLKRDDIKVFSGNVIQKVYFRDKVVKRNKGCGSDCFEIISVGKIRIMEQYSKGHYIHYDILVGDEKIANIQYHKKFFRFKWKHFIDLYSDAPEALDIALFCFFHIFNNDHVYVGT